MNDIRAINSSAKALRPLANAVCSLAFCGAILGAFWGAASTASAQSITPAVTSWTRNVGGQTGYGGIIANVTLIRHSAGFVYPSASGIPSYPIGPWAGNPNTPVNQSFVFKITKTPTVATTPTATPLGIIGALINGVPFFNPLDAMSYNNLNIWHRNAMFWEAASFDSCKSHVGPGGGHVVPTDSPVIFTGSACPADLDANRVVDAMDLATVLASWGGGGGAADIDRNGTINGGDLAMLLNAWGLCN